MSTTEKRDRAFAREGQVEHYFWRAVEAERRAARVRAQERRNRIGWAIIAVCLAVFGIAFLLVARWAIGGGRWT